MTLTTRHNRIPYVGNGTQTVFPYTFLITVATDLLVYHDDIRQTSGYTVSGVGLGAGGNVTYATAPASGIAILFLRDTDQTQQVNLIEGDRLPADPVEGMFDKAYAAIQDVAEHLDRAVTVPPSSTSSGSDLTLPDPSDPANQNKVLWINGSGQLEAREMVPADTIGSNPITTKGDLIQGSTSGTPERLPIGLTDQVLSVVGGKATWVPPTVSTIIDAKGDLLAGTGPDVLARKAVGANNTVLMADSTQPDGLRWGFAGVNAKDLDIAAATLPDTDPPHLVREISAGTPTANTPKASALVAQFNADTDQHLIWDLLLSSTYLTGGLVRLKWKAASASAGAVVWKAGIAATVDGSTADGTVVFNAADLASPSTAPASAGQVVEVTIALTMTYVAANGYARLFIGRDADHANDTMLNDAILLKARFEWA